MKKFTIMCMFPAFNYQTNLYSQKIFKDYEYIQDNNDKNIDIYLIGSFIKENDYKFIKNIKKDKIKILWISEPIIFHFKFPYVLIKENEFNYIYGCVLNNVNRYKLPLYINYYKGWENTIFYSKDYFNEINKKCKIIDEDELFNKKFCCLIARHDNWNTRKVIYNKLIQIDKITCPSMLFNNFDNKKFNEIGKIDFLKKFIFNLCPENSKYNYPGYITEKLMDSCISGCIPIYCGKLDDLDKKVFNIKRIIFYESDNEISMNKCILKINELYNNNQKLIDFYNQDIFNDGASEIINRLINNFKGLINDIKEL